MPLAAKITSFDPLDGFDPLGWRDNGSVLSPTVPQTNVGLTSAPASDTGPSESKMSSGPSDLGIEPLPCAALITPARAPPSNATLTGSVATTLPFTDTRPDRTTADSFYSRSREPDEWSWKKGDDGTYNGRRSDDNVSHPTGVETDDQSWKRGDDGTFDGSRFNDSVSSHHQTMSSADSPVDEWNLD